MLLNLKQKNEHKILIDIDFDTFLLSYECHIFNLSLSISNTPPPHLKYICNLLCTIICEAGSCHLICVQAWLANCFCDDCDGPRACGDVAQNGILHDCRAAQLF